MGHSPSVFYQWPVQGKGIGLDFNRAGFLELNDTRFHDFTHNDILFAVVFLL